MHSGRLTKTLPAKDNFAAKINLAVVYLMNAMFAKAWAVVVADLLSLGKCLLALCSPRTNFNINYGRSPLYQGITNSSVSDSLNILCNDFFKSE
jgi:hypothetical protein